MCAYKCLGKVLPRLQDKPVRVIFMWVSCNVGSRYKLDKAKKCIFLRQSARRWTMMKIDKRVFKRMKHKSQSYFFVRSDLIVFSDLELSLLKNYAHSSLNVFCEIFQYVVQLVCVYNVQQVRIQLLL